MLRLRWPLRQSPNVRIAAFIDGFNVYYGLKHKGFQRFLWLDYRALVETFVRPDQDLVRVYYFTTRITKPADSQKRQSTYLDALRARGGLDIIEGSYTDRPVKCPGCGHQWKRPTEKMTDVNLATRLLVGALRDQYDIAIVISADADIIPAVRVVRETGKRVIVVSPRGRTSSELAAACDAHLHVGTALLGRCQLPPTLTSIEGYPLARPSTWV